MKPAPPLAAPPFLVRMGDRIHGKWSALIVAGVLTGAPGVVFFTDMVLDQRAEEKKVLIARAKKQYDEKGYVLMYRGAEISKQNDLWAPDRDERITILADDDRRISFAEAEKEITEHHRNEYLPYISGAAMGGMAGMLGMFGLSIATLACRQHMERHRKRANNRRYMNKEGLDRFNPN